MTSELLSSLASALAQALTLTPPRTFSVFVVISLVLILLGLFDLWLEWLDNAYTKDLLKHS